MFKNILKFIGALALVVVAGIGIIWGIQYLRFRESPTYQVMENVKKLEKAYTEDTYGGETPEETLQLFIDALKAEDVELAAKYFLIEDQRKWKNELLIMKEKGLLKFAAQDLEKSRLAQKEGKAYVTLIDENNVAISEMVMIFNPLNNRWKISEL